MKLLQHKLSFREVNCCPVSQKVPDHHLFNPNMIDSREGSLVAGLFFFPSEATASICYEVHNPSEFIPFTISAEEIIHAWTLNHVGTQGQGSLLHQLPVACAYLAVLSIGIARGGDAPAVVPCSA